MKKLVLDEDYYGQADYPDDIPPKDRETINIRAQKHYKINQKSSNQMDYCLKLINETELNNQKLYFILPPAHRYYKEVLPKSEKLFEKLYEVCSGFSHIEIINLYDSDIFTDDDFTDGDHLSYSGAQKMTTIVREKINTKLVV